MGMKTFHRDATVRLLNEAGRDRLEGWESRVDFGTLQDLMMAWYHDYKDFERDDTIACAYQEQRLTVKGMSATWKYDIKFKVGVDGEGKDRLETFVDARGNTYPLDKGLKGMRLRLDPTNFLPYLRDGDDSNSSSQKLELGLHDVSTGLMKAGKPISEQQYKTLKDGVDNFAKIIYAFMPLGHPEDQALFQTLNDLGKRVRLERPNFYNLIRFIRARMTRVKLAAEHDMSTNFSLATPNYKTNRAGEKVPRLQFSLGNPTDTFAQDARYLTEADKKKAEKTHIAEMQLDLKKRAQEQANATRPKDGGEMPVAQGGIPLPPVDTTLKDKRPTKFMATPTPELLQARRQAALNYRKLVLDKYLRYGEMTIAYRVHEGGFPLFTMYSPSAKGFVVGKIVGDTWEPKVPNVIIPDIPV